MAATKLSLYQDALRLLADARLGVITDDVESRYALDDAWAESVAFVLRHAAWRFALVSVALSTTTGPLPGFTIAYSKPADWLRTHALFLIPNSDGIEYPVDIREQGLKFSSNAASVYVRYVSSNYLDPELASNPWPEHFARAVAAYLAFSVAERVTGERAAPARMSQVFQQHLQEAVARDAQPENPWLQFQLDGSFQLAARDLARQGNWRWAMKDAAISIVGGIPAAGFLYSFPRPTDWLKTHKLFVLSGAQECPIDAREIDTHWSTNTAAFQVRYVSATPALDPTLWPEPFRKALLTFLQEPTEKEPPPQGQRGEATEEWRRYLAEALSGWSEPEWPWLGYMFSGRFYRAIYEVLKTGFWRFAMTIATPISVGSIQEYTNKWTIPLDWVQTHALYVAGNTGRECPTDAREFGGFWYTNTSTLRAKYVSLTRGLDATLWPEPFAKVLIAFLAAEDSGNKEARALYDEVLGAALVLEADAPNPWLKAQLDGTFYRVARTLIDAGFWRFALVTVPINVIAGAGDGGFTNAFTIPTDAARTRSLYQLTADGRRRPFDVREAIGKWHTNATSFYAEYLSVSVAMNAVQWPDHYMRAVLRQIQFDRSVASDSSQSPPTYGRDYELRVDTAWKEALADTMDSEAIPEDPWLAHQFSGVFARAVPAIAQIAYWRFALKSLPYDVSMQDAAGDITHPYRYTLPVDWLKTHALFVEWDGHELPIDIREHEGKWSTAARSFIARYISTAALDPLQWPDPLAEAMRLFLAMEAADEKQKQAAAAEWQAALAAARATLALPEHRWLRFQLDGSMVDAATMMMEKGRWRFAVKTVELETANEPSNALITIGGTPTPGDTLSIVVGHSLIAGSPVTISTTVLSTDNLTSIAARLADALGNNAALSAAGISAGATGAVIATTLAHVLLPPTTGGTAGVPPIESQVSYTLQTSVGATATMTLSPYPSGPPASQGYIYRFAKPADWLKTIWLYRNMTDGVGAQRFDVDFREEDDAFHANFFPLTLRYLTRAGLDATRWPAGFRDAMLAWLEHSEMRSDPKMAGVAKAKLELFNEQMREAERFDDGRDMPRFDKPGRFVSGRYRRGVGTPGYPGRPEWL